MILRSAGRLLPASVIAGIYLLSAIPGSDLPPGPGIPHFDKVIHALIYAALLTSFRAWRGLCASPGEWLPGAIAACLVAAAGDEWHQGAVPSRSPDLLDLLADAVGIAIAALLWARWSHRPWHRSLLRYFVPPPSSPPGGPCDGSASPRNRRSSPSR